MTAAAEAGLAPLLPLAAALLAALLVQPLRPWRGQALRALLLLMALAAVPLQFIILLKLMPLAAKLAAYGLLALPQAALAAVLLYRPAPANLRPALAGLGRGQAVLFCRLELPALLPGLLLGWLAGAAMALACLAAPLLGGTEIGL